MQVIDKKLLKHLDWLTIFLVLTLFVIGLVSIASIMSSPYEGTEAALSDYVEKINFEYVERQIINFIVGFAALLVFLVIDYTIFKNIIKYFYIGIVFILLVLVLFGKTSRGVAGWFVFESIQRAIQPAELCKIILVLTFAGLISNAVERDGSLKRLSDITKLLGYFLIPTMLVALQPDFGTAFVFFCILVCVLFVSGIPWKYIIIALVALCVLAPIVYFFLLDKDQRVRIDVFLNPELGDPLGDYYNVTQSKLSIGSGQLSGKGYFTSGTLAQLKYVPERHTDFIFSGIVEAIGFLGGTAIIVLYFILIFRWLYVAGKAGNPYGTCIVIGVMAMLLAHVFENIGMTMGLTPVTGIPLPFISYGGSNLLTNMIGVGLVLNVYMRRPLSRFGTR